LSRHIDALLIASKRSSLPRFIAKTLAKLTNTSANGLDFVTNSSAATCSRSAT